MGNYSFFTIMYTHFSNFLCFNLYKICNLWIVMSLFINSRIVRDLKRSGNYIVSMGNFIVSMGNFIVSMGNYIVSSGSLICHIWHICQNLIFFCQKILQKKSKKVNKNTEFFSRSLLYYSNVRFQKKSEKVRKNKGLKVIESDICCFNQNIKKSIDIIIYCSKSICRCWKYYNK